MAIALEKTLQTVSYDLYIKSSVMFLSPTLLVLETRVYQSEGHYTDGFVPMILRQEVISASATISAFAGNYSSVPGIAAAEAWFVANVAWYSGGVVV